MKDREFLDQTSDYQIIKKQSVLRVSLKEININGFSY